jgi:hypothetical protein
MRVALLLAGVLLVLGAAAARDAAQQAPRPGVVVADTTVVTATVADVDAPARALALRTGDGDTVRVRVAPAVPKLDALRPGDRVRVEYFAPLAPALDPDTTGPRLQGTSAVALSTGDDRAERVVTSTVEAMATVESIARRARTITLRAPDGERVEVRVPDAVKRFDDVAPGDDVYARYTEPVAIDVQKR